MITPNRYSVKADARGTWLVFDAVTEDVAELLGTLLFGFGEELAHDIADLLNFEEGQKHSIPRPWRSPA